jgi:hypothetical protein
MMKMLVATAAASGFHLFHPEVIRERADRTHRLFEGMLDLEAEPVESDDVDCVKGVG